MKQLTVTEKDLYIRLPNNLENMDTLKLLLSKELGGKTLKISAVDNKNTPFEKNSIGQENDSAILCYFGDDSYWNPKETSRTFVEGNPSCDYSDCDCNCHVVSCGVHQGFSSGAPVTISYLYSDKLN